MSLQKYFKPSEFRDLILLERICAQHNVEASQRERKSRNNMRRGSIMSEESLLLQYTNRAFDQLYEPMKFVDDLDDCVYVCVHLAIDAINSKENFEQALRDEVLKYPSQKQRIQSEEICREVEEFVNEVIQEAIETQVTKKLGGAPTITDENCRMQMEDPKEFTGGEEEDDEIVKVVVDTLESENSLSNDSESLNEESSLSAEDAGWCTIS